MGKRSDFERKPRDFYPTPLEAVIPLIPHLQPGSSFIEPCAGARDLVRHLVNLGFRCLDAFDIEPQGAGVRQSDAMNMRLLDWTSDYIITNPPWGRKVLHRMIPHFASQRPTWLLFDADWMHTKQSAEFMPLLRKVVSVGRVKWIPDSKMTGKDNVCWYLFSARRSGPTHFVGRSA